MLQVEQTNSFRGRVLLTELRDGQDVVEMRSIT